MACSYCLDPSTPVLTAELEWKPIQDLKAGEKVAAFDEMSGPWLKNRSMRLATVEKVWETTKEAVRIVTTHGEVVCSLDHKFLNYIGRWVTTKNLEVGDRLLFSKKPWGTPATSRDYMRGYLFGMTAGDGTARWFPLPGATGRAEDSRRQIYWRVALKDSEPLERIVAYLDALEIAHPGIKRFSVANANYAAMQRIELRSQASVGKMHHVLFTETTENEAEFERGYLAGIFDAEGSYSQKSSLRISQKQENDVCDRTMRYMDRLGFSYIRERDGVRLLGGMWESIRFFGITQPAITRKAAGWVGFGVKHSKAEILSIEPLGVRRLVDIQTSTKTFYGAGFATHNCYHADKKNLPFQQRIMAPEIIKKIIREAADLGANSVKFNWRGESTMNPYFFHATQLAKSLANGSTFIDRLTNSNFKFDASRDDIFKGLCHQTKVKVSYDSFIPEVFEKQRYLGDHAVTTANIDRFYNWPGRDTQLVIQAVRTSRNKDEDIEGQAKKRWPSALVSIRDMVEGRVNKDLSEIKHKTRDYSERQTCIQAHARLIFDWSGEAVPCCPDIKQGLKLGSIKDKSMAEIFNGQLALELRRDLLSGKAFEKDPCKNCSSFETYKGFVASFDS